MSGARRVIYRMIGLASLFVMLSCGLGGCRRRIVQEDMQKPRATEQAQMKETEAPTERPSDNAPTAEPLPTEELVREAAPTEQAEELSETEILEATVEEDAPEAVAATEMLAATEMPAIAPQDGISSSNGGAAAAEEATDRLAETEIVEQESETNPADEGGAVGVIIDESAQFLRAGLGALYECEKGYVYIEGVADYVTAARGSAMHSLVVEAGGYNVAEKLQGAAPVVEADWVLRKNPNVIVKCVDSLGAGVTSSAAAQATIALLTSRPGWENIGAVMSRTIVLLSEELLKTEEGRLLAKLYIAEAMYPTLFAQKSIAKIAEELAAAGGKSFMDGLYVYSVSNGL